MDSKNTTTSTGAARKRRFAPRVPPKKAPKPAIVKKEETDDADATKELLRQFNESSMMGRPKVEKKVAPSQVAFGFGASSISMRSYGAPKGDRSNTGAGASDTGPGLEKEYREPWDYYSNYPATVPLRRPYSGDPELLDEEEFGEAALSVAYDEHSKKSSVELGLTAENQETSMFFLQLPATMPMIKRSATADGKNSNPKPPSGASRAEKTCRLDELPAGYMGKMLVYRSGAVKMKLGDTLYDVSPGLDCVFAQDVVAINTEEKHCCILGELNKRAVVVPDVDSIIDGIADL